MADPHSFFEYHGSPVSGFLLGVPVVDQRREFRPGVHLIGVVRLTIRQFLPQSTGHDNRAVCGGCRAGVDVSRGET